jgi:hypothetical protein
MLAEFSIPTFFPRSTFGKIAWPIWEGAFSQPLPGKLVVELKGGLVFFAGDCREICFPKI